MSEIPSGLFQNQKHLKKLMLFFNDISFLQKSAFEGLTSLRILLLNNNLIRDFQEDVFNPLVQLQKL